MTSIDPINTTEHDGAACVVCGEDATGKVQPLGDLFPSVICQDCQHDLVTVCPGCEAAIWQVDGYRLSGASLYCSTCFYSHPVVVGDLAAALAADERAGK